MTATVGRSRLLAGLAVTQLLVALDFSIIYVALPDLGRSLAFDPVALQWVVSVYAIAFAGLLLPAGRCVDRFGAGRAFVLGHLVFSGAALGAGCVSDPWLLIVFRTFQGAGAALLNPATLALLQQGFPAGRERRRAIAVWGTTGAGGLALGVVVGGILVQELSWRWIFWINVLVSVPCVLAILRGERRTGPATKPQPVSVGGALAATGAISAFCLALTGISHSPPDRLLVTLAAIAAALCGAALYIQQRTGAAPLIPPDLLRHRDLRTVCAVAALFMASLGAEFYLLTLYLQQVLEWSALKSGLGFLPLAAAVSAGNALAGRLAAARPVRTLLTGAFLTGSAGLLLLATGTSTHDYTAGMLPGLIISGLGQGVAFTGMYLAGTTSLATAREGTASAMITAAQYSGGAIGLAILAWIHGPTPDPASLAQAFTATTLLALLALPLISRLSPEKR